MKKSIVLCVLIVLITFTGCGAASGTMQENEAVTTTPAPTSAPVEQEAGELKPEYRTEQILTRDDKGKLVFYFFDVPKSREKWGDSTLICFPNNETMLIDAGKTNAGKHIVEMLKQLGIERIDYAVVSHMHGDHFRGFYELMDNVEIGAMYTPNLVYPPNFDGQTWEEALKTREIEHLRFERGNTLDIGDVHIEVLRPESNEENNNLVEKAGDTAAVCNDLSGVMKFQYGDNTALFVGDLYIEGEKELVSQYGDQLQVDLLKIPHHGDSTSSSDLFVNTVKPKVAVAMGNVVMGKHVYERYTDVGAKTYITFVDGMVKVTMDGKEIDILTEHDRTVDFYD